MSKYKIYDYNMNVQPGRVYEKVKYPTRPPLQPRKTRPYITAYLGEYLINPSQSPWLGMKAGSWLDLLHFQVLALLIMGIVLAREIYTNVLNKCDVEQHSFEPVCNDEVAK
jgi:hypothetical protein